MFLAVSNQWRINDFSGEYYGLDYPSIDIVIKYREIEVNPKIFEKLQLFESEALKVLNEQS